MNKYRNPLWLLSSWKNGRETAGPRESTNRYGGDQILTTRVTSKCGHRIVKGTALLEAPASESSADPGVSLPDRPVQFAVLVRVQTSEHILNVSPGLL